MLVAACSKDPYLYDRTGFDEGARPVVAPNPNSPNTVSPDYYRQQNPYQYQQPNPYQSYAPPYQQQYQQAPSYAVPYQQGGGSRYYSNPYSIPAAPAGPGYYQRSDVDQYYSPPTYYNNVEQQKITQSSGAGSRY